MAEQPAGNRTGQTAVAGGHSRRPPGIARGSARPRQRPPAGAWPWPAGQTVARAGTCCCCCYYCTSSHQHPSGMEKHKGKNLVIISNAKLMENPKLCR